MLLEELGAIGGPDALGRRYVLDADRDAVERSEGGLFLEGGGGASRLPEHGLAIERHDGVDLGIDSIDALQEDLHHLERRDLAGAVEADELDSRSEAEIAGHSHGDSPQV